MPGQGPPDRLRKVAAQKGSGDPGSTTRPQWRKRARSSATAVIGFVLSPLSWWNDLVVNIPLAYLFAWPFSAWNDRLYVPAFVLGYWLTNIVGLVLLHKGVSGAVLDKKTGVKWDLWIATGYTALIALVAWLGWLPSPTTLLDR